MDAQIVTFVDRETGEIVGEVERPDRTVSVLLDFLSDMNFRFTPTGLEVVGSPTFQDCESKCSLLCEFRRLSLIFLGDLLNYMEGKWGEKYAQVLDPMGHAYQTKANAKSVMGKVAPGVRQPDLTFTHYKIAAPFPPAKQKKLLQRARDKGMNTAEFNRLARQERRRERLGVLPSRVKMEMTAVFEVPEDLKGELRQLAEGWTGRLWERDIECLDLAFKEEDGE